MIQPINLHCSRPGQSPHRASRRLSPHRLRWRRCPQRAPMSPSTPLVLLLLLLTACTNLPAPILDRLYPTEAQPTLTASGFIEGLDVTLATEVGGRIDQVLADRGDTVTQGDVVIRLDDSALHSQRREAEAAIASAEAHLAQVLAGARPEEIALARADLAQAEAQAAGAREAAISAREAITNPQTLDARIHEAQSQVALAEQGVEQAEAELAATRLAYSVYEDHGGDVARTWELQLEAAEADLAQAEAQLAGARAVLGVLYAQRANPLQLEAQRHQAETDAGIAATQAAALEARLAELTAGPSTAEIGLAEAQLAQAEAALGVIDARLAQLTLTAPLDGIIATKAVQEGEIATPGQPLLTIANLDEVTLTIYVAQSQIGQVQIGQSVTVTVEAFPDRTFRGTVVAIAGEAQFTPRNVQTSEERANLVFAVDISLPNPDRGLKPGMPADAVLQP